MRACVPTRLPCLLSGDCAGRSFGWTYTPYNVGAAAAGDGGGGGAPPPLPPLPADGAPPSYAMAPVGTQEGRAEEEALEEEELEVDEEVDPGDDASF